MDKDKVEFKQPLIKSAVLEDLKEAKKYVAGLKESADKGEISEKDKMYVAELTTALNSLKTSAYTLSIQETANLQVTLTPECSNNNLDFNVEFVTWRGTNKVEKTYIFYTQKYIDGTKDFFNGGTPASFFSPIPAIPYWFWAQSVDGSLKSCPRLLERDCTTAKVQKLLSS